MGEHFIFVFIFCVDFSVQVSRLERLKIVLLWRSDACAVPFGLCDLLFKNAFVGFIAPLNTESNLLINAEERVNC